MCVLIVVSCVTFVVVVGNRSQEPSGKVSNGSTNIIKEVQLNADKTQENVATDAENKSSTTSNSTGATPQVSKPPSQNTVSSNVEVDAFKQCMSNNELAGNTYRAVKDSIVASHRSQEDYILANYNVYDQKPLLINLYSDSQSKADSAYASYRSKVYSLGPTSFNATCSPGYTSGYIFTRPYGL